MRTCWFSVYTLKKSVSFKVFLVFVLSTYMIGCGGQTHLSSERLAEFENAGHYVSNVDIDMERILRAKIDAGSYRVISGDVLELTMPVVLQALVTELSDLRDKVAPYPCRVDDNGTITLPMIGEIHVAGKTLPEIESAVIDAYYPTYTITRPSVIARVMEHKTYKASITGAVQKPGFYELRSDQMSLVALLMQAGGITDGGAARIRITNTKKLAKAYKERHDNNYVPSRYAVEYAARSSKTQRVKLASHYLGSNEFDVGSAQITFQRVSPSSTIGRLTIRHEQTILFDEQLDITNEIQRWTILDKLAETEPSIAPAEAGKIWVKICELTELLKSDPGMKNHKETFANAYVVADINNRIGDLKKPASEANPSIKTHSGSFGAIEMFRSIEQPETSDFEGSDAETIVLPVKGLNIPFADVTLEEGDIVEVEPFETPLFTVVGLVNKPGNFPYPPTAQYNLMQAIAFAGGLDRIAKPRYATIYRLKEDGSIVKVPFQIIGKKNNTQMAEASSILIKAGDIVVVEETLRTRTNEFLQKIFNFNMGAYLPVTGVGG